MFTLTEIIRWMVSQHADIRGQTDGQVNGRTRTGGWGVRKNNFARLENLQCGESGVREIFSRRRAEGRRAFHHGYAAASESFQSPDATFRSEHAFVRACVRFEAMLSGDAFALCEIYRSNNLLTEARARVNHRETDREKFERELNSSHCNKTSLSTNRKKRGEFFIAACARAIVKQFCKLPQLSRVLIAPPSLSLSLLFFLSFPLPLSLSPSIYLRVLNIATQQFFSHPR